MSIVEMLNRLPKEVGEKLKATEQNPIYHAEGNVYIHTQMVYEEVEKLYPDDTEMLVAAVFHDLGKIDTTFLKTKKDGTTKISSDGHEFTSLKYLDLYLDLFEDLVVDKSRIYAMVKYHMKAHLYREGKIKKPSKINAFESNKYFEDIMKFSECDEKGRIRQSDE